MPFPIIAVVMAAAAAKKQREEQRKAHELAQRQHMADVEASIREKRAARSGDAGYMHGAMRAMTGQPRMPEMDSQVLGQVGGAIASAQQAPKIPQGQYVTNPGPLSGVQLREDEF